MKNPYPESIFSPMTSEEVKEAGDALTKAGISPDRVFGNWGREVWDNALQAAEREKEEILDAAREAIVAAICSEDGLDGAAGEGIVKWITDVLGDYEEFIKTHTDDRWQEK